MNDDLQVEDVAVALRLSIGFFIRTLRQSKVNDAELSVPEGSALAWLDRSGPSTSAEMARAEGISPQSMGATLSGLESRRLVHRAADSNDGRRVVLTITDRGRRAINDRREARTQCIAKVLSNDFTAAERTVLMKAAPLIERLARSI